MKAARLILTIFTLCAVLAVAGCGVRPGRLAAPEGADPDAYPRTYPDPATDPAPKQAPKAQEPDAYDPYQF